MKARIILAAVLISSASAAQELPEVPEFKLQAVPAGPDVIISLLKGEKATVDGQLFGNDTALRWANYLEQYDLQLKECHKSYRALLASDQRYHHSILAYEKKSRDEVVGDLTSRLERVEVENAKLQGQLSKGPPWYNTRTFGIVLGVVGTSVLVTAGAAIAFSVQ